MSTALAFSEENFRLQSVDFPCASRGPSDVVVTSKGTASACQARARAWARSHASLAVIAAGLPVLPAAQAGLICARAKAGNNQTAARATARRGIAADRCMSASLPRGGGCRGWGDYLAIVPARRPVNLC